MAKESSARRLHKVDLIAFFEREIKSIIDTSEDEILIVEKLTEWREKRCEDRDEALAKALGAWLEKTRVKYKVRAGDPDAADLLYEIKTVSYVAMNVANSGGNAELIMRYLAEPMLKIVCLELPTEILLTVMESLINCAKMTARVLRESLYPDLRSHLRSMATRLARCGDYPTQVSLLRILVHLMPRADPERSVAADYIFTQESYSAGTVVKFLELDFTNFFMHSRQFLMAVNNYMETVVHFVCSRVVLDDVHLIGPTGDKTDHLHVELNIGSRSVTMEWNPGAVERACGQPLYRHLGRSERGQLTAAADSLQEVRMDRSLGLEVIDVRAKGIAIFRSPHDVVSLLRLYPLHNLLGIHGALRHMYQDKYVCGISIDEVEDWNYPIDMPFVQGSNISSDGQEGERNVESRSSRQSICDTDMVRNTKRCSVTLSRRLGCSRVDTSSGSSDSTTSLLALRQILETHEPTRTKKFKYPFEPTCSDVHEIPPKKISVRTSGIAKDGICPIGEVDNDLEEQSDVQLVNDLYQAALMDSTKEWEKDTAVTTSPRSTKDKTKSPRTEKESTRNKENAQIDANSLNHGTDNTQNLNEKVYITSPVISKRLKSSKLDKRQDATITDATNDSTSDAIPDTPNVDMTKHFGNISVRKALDIVAQESKSTTSKESDGKSTSPKRTYLRSETRTPEQSKTTWIPKTDSLLTKRKLATITVSSEREELNVSSMKPLKRKLYSPKSDFIIQDNDSEMDQIHHYHEDVEENSGEIAIRTKKRQRNTIKPVFSSYVLLEPLQVKPKSKMDEEFDKLKASNGEDQPVTLVNVMKDTSVYNFESSDDDFQPDKKWKRNSGDSTNITKTTNSTKRKRKSPNPKSKVKKGVATNIKKAAKQKHILIDEKIRRQPPAEELLDISLQRDSSQQKKSDTECIMPERLDTIDIEEIPENDNQKSTDAVDLRLSKPKSKSESSVSKEKNTIDVQEKSANLSLSKSAVSMPQELGTTKIRELVQNNSKKTINVDYRSLRNPKIKPAAVKKECKPPEKRKMKRKEKTVKEQLDEMDCSSSPQALTIEVEEKRNESFSYLGPVVRAILSSKESNTHTIEMQPSSSVCDNFADVSLASNIDCDAHQSSEKSNVTRRCHVVIYSSPESVGEKSIPTVKGTPINAHGDSEEKPPNLTLLDDTVQGRDLQTERLNSTDREFIEKLRANNETLRSQNSFVYLERIMLEKSDSHKEKSADNVMRMSYSTPNKSDSTSCNPKTPSHLSFQLGHISPIECPLVPQPWTVGEQNINASLQTTSENLKDSTVSQHATGFTVRLSEENLTAQSSLHSALQPETAEKVAGKDSPKQGDRIPNLRESYTSQDAEAESTVKNVCEVLLQTIETGIRESGFGLKNGLVDALAEYFAGLEEGRELTQKLNAELIADREKFMERMKEVEQQRARTVQQLKGKIRSEIQNHTQQCNLRVELLREDVRSMLRRYARTGERSIRVCSPNHH